MTDVWAAFVAARLDEDEAEAKATADADAEFWADVRGDGTHFALHDPARVLREVAALREAVAQIFLYESAIDIDDGCRHIPSQIAAGECPSTKPGDIPGLTAIAAIWSGHADYPGHQDHSGV